MSIQKWQNDWGRFLIFFRNLKLWTEVGRHEHAHKLTSPVRYHTCTCSHGHLGDQFYVCTYSVRFLHIFMFTHEIWCALTWEKKKIQTFESHCPEENYVSSASKASLLFPKSRGSQAPHFLWKYRSLFSEPKRNRVVEVNCIKLQGAHFSPLQTPTYSLKWQLALTCREQFFLNTVTQQEAQSIINVCVEINCNLGLQNNMVTLHFLLFMKLDRLYFPQLVKWISNPSKHQTWKCLNSAVIGVLQIHRLATPWSKREN